MLIRVVAWRIVSMLIMFLISILFTGSFGASISMVLVTGLQQFVFQWLFEMAWSKFLKKRVRNAFARKQS